MYSFESIRTHKNTKTAAKFLFSGVFVDFLDCFGVSKIDRWWPISESNQGHNDFQSFALPTELIGHVCEAEIISR